MTRHDDDFAREIESHIALETDRLIAEGLSRDDAAAAALRRFGNRTRARERFYESRRWRPLEHLRQDVRYALRRLAQSPAFTFVAVGTLALGIGSAAAVATQINAVYFETPAVTDAARLRTLAWTSPRRGFTGSLFRGPQYDTRRIESFPLDTCRELARLSTTFSDVACWRDAGETMTDAGLARLQAVSGSFFTTLGVQPLKGRPLTAEDDAPGAPLVALARTPDEYGRTVRLHGHPFTIVGILPPAFSGLQPLEPADYIVPYSADRLFPVFQRNAWAESRIVGRMRGGVDEESARAEAEVIVQQFVQAQAPGTDYELPRLWLQDLAAGFGELRQSVARPLWLLSATVGLLLLVTCANVGGLQFARGRARQKELATRLALGGSRGRVVQQLLTESVVLGVIGGGLGVMVAVSLTPWLPRLLAELGQGSRLGVQPAVDVGVLAFAVAVTLASGVLVGLLPALSSTRFDPGAAIRDASGIAPPGKLRAGKVALGLQLALSMIVLIGAGLLVRTMVNLRGVPLGYVPERLVFVETENPPGRPRAVVEETLASLRALPGVAAAAVSQWPIFNNAVPRFAFCVPGHSTAESIDYSFVFPGFFDTWGVRFLAGRDIDDSAAPQVVVNETFVRQYLDGRNPLEASISSGAKGCPGPTQLPIVGVVADHIDRQRVEVIPAVYGRYPRAGALYVTTYAVRAAGDERALIPAVRRVIADHRLAPVRDVRLATEYRDSVMRQESLLARLLVAAGAAALFISCLGVYGMLAYTVQWRVPEIGVRMAVGAPPGALIWMIVRESLLPVGIGAACGIVTAALLSRTIEGLLFGVGGTDRLTWVVAGAVLVSTAAAAAWFAARRAAAIDPVSALQGR